MSIKKVNSHNVISTGLDSSSGISDGENLAADTLALESLFSQARSEQSILLDENFTKVVINSLPNKPKRTQARPLMFDFIGLVFGLLAAYWFFDSAQIASNALALVPESFSITVSNIVSVFGAAIGITYLGWWTAEKAVN